MKVNVMICPNCGGHLTIDPQTRRGVCENCFSEVLIDEKDEQLSNIISLVFDKIEFGNIYDSQIEKLIVEGLQINPKAGELYLAKLFLRSHCSNFDELAKANFDFSGLPEYIRASQFLTGELKAALISAYEKNKEYRAWLSNKNQANIDTQKREYAMSRLLHFSLLSEDLQKLTKCETILEFYAKIKERDKEFLKFMDESDAEWLSECEVVESEADLGEYDEDDEDSYRMTRQQFDERCWKAVEDSFADHFEMALRNLTQLYKDFKTILDAEMSPEEKDLFIDMLKQCKY